MQFQRKFKKSSDFSSRGRFSDKSNRSDRPFKPYKSFSRESGANESYDKPNQGSESIPYSPNNEYSKPRDWGDRGNRDNRGGGDRGNSRYGQGGGQGYKSDFKKSFNSENRPFQEYRENRPFDRERQGRSGQFAGGGDRERGTGYRDRDQNRDQGGRPNWSERKNFSRPERVGGGYRGGNDRGRGFDRGDRFNRGERGDQEHRGGQYQEGKPAVSLLIGIRPIEEAINRGVKFNQLYLQKSEDQKPSRFEDFIQYCKSHKINFFFLEKTKLDELSGHKLHQGVIAELKQDTRIVHDLQEYLTKNPPHGEVVLVLDRLTDQQNVGAIARSAYFFGCRLIVSEKTHSAPINEVVHKVSAGASLMVSFYFAEKLSQAINTLKDFGFTVIATSVEKNEENVAVAGIQETQVMGVTGEDSANEKPPANPTAPAIPSIPLRELKPDLVNNATDANYAVVMGSEGSGLRPHLERLADMKVHIPRLSDFDSLNVSVATGIVLYAMMESGFIQPPKALPPVIDADDSSQGDEAYDEEQKNSAEDDGDENDNHADIDAGDDGNNGDGEHEEENSE